MLGLFDKTFEIHIPRRYEYTGGMHGNKIEKIARLEKSEHVRVSWYKSKKTKGFRADLSEAQHVIFLPKKTVANLGIKNLILVPSCASPEDLHEKSKIGEISWLRPKPRLVKDLSINEIKNACQNVRESWKGKFEFREEVRVDSEVTQSGLRPPQIGSASRNARSLEYLYETGHDCHAYRNRQDRDDASAAYRC